MPRPSLNAPLNPDRLRAHTWVFVGLLLIVTCIGCKSGEPSSKPESTPKPSSTPDGATTQTERAAAAIRKEVPESLVDRVRSDALRYLTRTPDMDKIWPTPDDKAIAYYHMVKLLSKVAETKDWPTSKALNDTMDNLMFQEYHRALVEREMGEIAVTDGEIQEYYKNNVNKYQTKGQFSIQHIFLNVVDNPADKEKKREIGNKIVEEAKGGRSFGELARLYSDVEGKKDEVVPPLPYGEINPILEKAIVAIEPGEVTDLIETKYGFNVFKLVAIDRPTTKPLQSVHDEIEQLLLTQKKRAAWAKAQKTLAEKYPVEINYAPLGSPNVPDDTVIASGKFIQLTVADYRKRLEEIPPSARPPQVRAEDRAMVIDRWIDSDRIRYLAREKNLDSDPEIKALREYLTERTRAVAAMNELVKNVPEPTQEEIEKAYKEKPEISMRPEQVRLREIVIKYSLPQNATRRELYLAQKEAQSTASKVIAELAEGAEFAALVHKYSKDDSAQKNDGDLGLAYLKTQRAQVAAAVAELEVGQWTQPVEEPARNAITIYKLEEKNPAELLPMDQLRESNIRNLLKREKTLEAIGRIQEKLAAVYRDDLTADEIEKAVGDVLSQ